MRQDIQEFIQDAVESSGFSYTLADARDPDVPLVYANQAFQALTGYGEEEIIGRNCRFLQGPETDKASVNRIRHALDAKRPISTMLLNYRKDGSKFWNRFQLSPVWNRDGDVTAFLGAQIDLTQDYTIDTLEKERQKIESLGRMAGGVAHELNNALQPPLLMAEMLEDMLDDFPEERRDTAKECVAKIIEHTYFAKDIVSQILDYARHSEPAITTVPVTLCVEDAADFAQTLIPIGVSVVIDYAPEIRADAPSITVGRNALRQVFNNLLLNAYHAMSGEGVVRVDVYPAPQHEVDVQATLKKGQPHIAISLSDTGPGISADVLPHIFDPFFTTKGVGEGTGLGLSTVFGIVRSWGGSIGVRNINTEGRVSGACFTLYLPVETGLGRNTH